MSIDPDMIASVLYQLEMLRKAIEADDPEAEIKLRVKDIVSELEGDKP